MARPLEFDRKVVLEKAMQVFWEQGFEATSLDDLTVAMNIKRPSLYNSFGDKETLYLEALKHYQDISSTFMFSVFNTTPDVMSGFKKMFYEAVNSDDACFGCMVVTASNEFANRNQNVADIVRSAEVTTEKAFKELIEKAQQNNEIDASIDAKNAAAILYNTLIGIRTQARGGVAGDKLEQITNSVLSQFT